jgi:hypothetical protein
LCVFVHIFSSQLQIVKIIVGDKTIFVCAISFGLIQLSKEYFSSARLNVENIPQNIVSPT